MYHPKKMILLGKNGQLGFSLQRALNPLGTLYAFDRQSCDLSNRVKLREVIQIVKPDIIVNAAAYTAVDKAETEIDAAIQINAEAPSVLATLAKNIGAHLIHYSTDYVFDGSKIGPYQEEDVINPLNQYGKSKYLGEKAIQEVEGQYWILRTSWVFSYYGKNFLKTILNLARTRSELTVVADQYGVPTSADFLADITAQMIIKSEQRQYSTSGLYHLVPEGKTTWYDFAQFIVQYAHELGMNAQLAADKLRPIAAKDYPLPAMRPYNSCLNTDKIRHTFDLALPNWRWYVQHSLTQLLAH